MIPRGTTPTLQLEIDDESLDLSTVNHVYVTLKNGNNVLTKQDADLTTAVRPSPSSPRP